jgi:hypothetical protein
MSRHNPRLTDLEVWKRPAVVCATLDLSLICMFLRRAWVTIP